MFDRSYPKKGRYFFMILVPLDSQSLQLSENVEKVFPLFFSLIFKNSRIVSEIICKIICINILDNLNHINNYW